MKGNTVREGYSRMSGILRSAGAVTLLSLLLRLASLFTQSRLAENLGAEGLGLLQLALSVQALAVTLATSGIRYSATRLIAQELGRGRGERVRRVIRGCVLYALGFSLPAMAGAFLLADTLAAFAGDGRIAPALRLLSLGLPFLSLNGVLGGYFTAVGRPWKGTAVQLFEQLCGTALILLFLSGSHRGTAGDCAAVAGAVAAGDLASLLLSLILYRRDLRLLPAPDRPCPPFPLASRLLRLSLPLAFSSYARTALSTLRSLLVPKALRRSGVGAARALEVYGVVGGMVMPVLTFSSVFFLALAEQLIPALTRAQVRRDRTELEATAGRSLRLSLFLSSGIALGLWLLGPALGLLLYRSREAGELIRALAPLVIVMYLDTVVDGMLKGLGLQLDSMLINLADACLTLLAVWFLLPRFGVPAYVAILYGSECFNFLLSFLRLGRSLRTKLL